MSEINLTQLSNRTKTERATARLIFFVLIVLCLGTIWWIMSYHQIYIDNTGGFHWNPRDGSVIEATVEPNTDAGKQSIATTKVPATTSTPQPTFAPIEVSPVGTPIASVSAEVTQEPNQNSAAPNPPPSTIRPQPEQYLSWFQAALLGIIMFLMNEVFSWYPKIGKPNGGEFQKYLLWYAGHLFLGPIIALVILWVLTNLNLNLGTTNGTGLSINFGALPAIVLLAFAWMLGFYSRVTRKQLDQIMKQLLPQAWAEAHKDKNLLTIDGSASLIQGQRDRFTTSLREGATWLISDPANIKSIELSHDGDLTKSYDATQLPQSLLGMNLYVNVTALEDSAKSGKIVIRAMVADMTSYAEIEILLAPAI